MNDKHTILIIDDTADNLMFLGEALSADYRIKIATNGEQGIELARKDPMPDIILLDIMMPGIDGYEVCRRLKADKHTLHIPIIFISALNTEDDELQGLEAGAVDFITKPFKMQVVRARIITQIELLEMRKELHAARVKAEAASQSKSVFLANMSHEIRTPMSAIMGMTDLALEDDTNSEHKYYLETIKLSADSLLALINDILDFSKIEAGQLELDEHPFNLAEAIETSIRTVSILSQEKGLKILLDIPHEIPIAVLGDSLRFRQIILNLLSNAIKFSDKSPIRVGVTLEETLDDKVRLRISVADQGIGIKADKIGDVFSAFSQADSSVSRKFGGTGLGLAICRQLSQFMGGDIMVESEHGQGATFSFTVVFGISETERLAKKETKDLKKIQIMPLRILLVEDDPINRLLIRIVLERLTHKVIEAVDGIEALHILLKDQFDLILSDIQMPELDGYSLARVIRACEEGKEIEAEIASALDVDLVEKLRDCLQDKHQLIISLTANAMSGDKEKCFNAGMDDYLTKPIDKQEMLVTFKRWLPEK